VNRLTQRVVGLHEQAKRIIIGAIEETSFSIIILKLLGDQYRTALKSLSKAKATTSLHSAAMISKHLSHIDWKQPKDQIIHLGHALYTNMIYRNDKKNLELWSSKILDLESSTF
jgi:methionyl-tRNA formyltransferase